MQYGNYVSDTMYIEILKYQLTVIEKGGLEITDHFKELKEFRDSLDTEEKAIFDKEFGGLNMFFSPRISSYEAFNIYLKKQLDIAGDLDQYINPTLGGDYSQDEEKYRLLEANFLNLRQDYIASRGVAFASLTRKLEEFYADLDWSKFEQYFRTNLTETRSKDIYAHIKANLTHIETTEEFGEINQAIIRLNITLTNQEQILYNEDPSLQSTGRGKLDLVNNDIYQYYTDVLFRKYDVFSLILGKNYFEEEGNIRNIKDKSYNYRCHFIGYITETHTSFTDEGVEFEIVLKGFEQLMNEIKKASQTLTVKGKYSVWRAVMGDDVVNQAVNTAKTMGDMFPNEFGEGNGDFGTEFFGHLLVDRQRTSYYSAGRYAKHIYVYFRTAQMSYAANDIVVIGAGGDKSIKDIEKQSRNTYRRGYEQRYILTNKEINEIRSDLKTNPELARQKRMVGTSADVLNFDTIYTLSTLGLVPDKKYWRKRIYMPDIYTMNSRLLKYREKYPDKYSELERLINAHQGRGLTDIIIATYFGYVTDLDEITFQFDEPKSWTSDVPDDDAVTVFEFVHDLLANSRECVFSADLPASTEASWAINEDYASRDTRWYDKDDRSDFFENGIYFIGGNRNIGDVQGQSSKNYSSILSKDYLTKWLISKNVYVTHNKTTWELLKELADLTGCYCFTSWFFAPSNDPLQKGYVDTYNRMNYRKALYLLYFVSKKEWLDYALEMSDNLFGKGNRLIIFNPLGINNREKAILKQHRGYYIQVLNADAKVHSNELKIVGGLIYDPVNRLEEKEMKTDSASINRSIESATQKKKRKSKELKNKVGKQLNTLSNKEKKPVSMNDFPSNMRI